MQCEIDELVVETSKRFYPTTLATVYIKGDPRFKLVFGDGSEFIHDKKAQYDVIIVDSSDPVGPANPLFSDEFYANLAQALKPGGIVCTQGECMWQNAALIKKVLTRASTVFGTVDYAFASVPTYPSGQIGFILATNTKDREYRVLIRLGVRLRSLLLRAFAYVSHFG